MPICWFIVTTPLPVAASLGGRSEVADATIAGSASPTPAASVSQNGRKCEAYAGVAPRLIASRNEPAPSRTQPTPTM
jgi:hypothetical protein